MLTDAKRTGYFGENKSCVYLRNKGYKILCGNFHSLTGEIDIIAETDENICFIEVKTRKSDAVLPPSEAVDSEKRNNIRNTASYFRKLYKSDKHSRYDIIEVVYKSFDDFEINHTENAF